MEYNNNNGNEPGRSFRSVGMFILLPIVIFLVIWFLFGSLGGGTDMKYSEYLRYFQQDQVEHFELNFGSGSLKILLKEEYREDLNRDGKVDENDVIRYTVPDVSLFLDDVRPLIKDGTATGVTYDYASGNGLAWLVNLLPTVVLLAFGVMFWIMMRRSINNMDGGKMMGGFSKARIKKPQDEKRKTTFADVAGADEEKEELEEVVEFLKSPKRYKELGARVPKGVLLVGPPGTGKTLLARAVAGEAGVPFFSISGSDFVEMYVGVGASRVRDLFDQAKKNSPCIIFMDEIDAVGRQRGAGLGGGHDEREQTLNQLLVEMDGFGANEGVIMIAATNRPDILDKALLRPGRFDRQIVVSYPDVKGREEILRVHAKGKPLAPDVDLSVIAKSTAGFTGADLENLLNEAALLAARKHYHSVTMEEIEEATIKVVMGTEKRSRIVTEKEKKLTAYHEAGHAVVTYYCPTQDPVHQVSIVPRGSAGGYTMHLPSHDQSYRARGEMLEFLQVLLGGRVAEALTLDDISTGASNDIERATELATQMVTKYGMSDLGPITFGSSEGDEVFLGRDFGHTRNYSEEVAAKIDKEIKRFVDEAYRAAEQKLTEHRDKLEKVAQYLFQNEKLDGEQFRKLMEEEALPSESENG